jgi:hypothetical protein
MWKPSALKREHPALQNMKFKFFLFLWVIFALLDPGDPDSKSGSESTDLIKITFQELPFKFPISKLIINMRGKRILFKVKDMYIQRSDGEQFPQFFLLKLL